MKKKKVLLVSEFSLLNTGFSVMNYDILKKLMDSGRYEVAELASYVSDSDPKIHDVPWKVYPVTPDQSNEKDWSQYQKNYQTAQFGSERFEDVVLDFKPDVVFSYRDYWHDEWITRSPYRNLFDYAWSTCVDSEPPKEEWISTFSTVDKISSYTDWGLNVIKNNSRGTVNMADFNTMPGVDLELFKPRDKLVAREEFGLEKDAIIFLSVMRNQPRKLYPGIIRSFMGAVEELYRRGEKEKADKCYLYIHASNTDVGYDLQKEVIKHGASSRILFTYVCDQCGSVHPSFSRCELSHCPSCNSFSSHTTNTSVGASREQLARIYNCADLYIQAATAGALEIPIIEAKACGLPVIVSDYAAPYELNEMGGVFARLPIIGFNQESIRETGQFRAIIDTDNIKNHILEFLETPKEKIIDLSEEARRVAEENHSTDLTAEKWMSIIDSLGNNLDPGRWTKPPSHLSIDVQSIPPGLDDASLIRYAVENFLPPRHQLKGFVAEKEFLKKCYLQGSQMPDGQVKMAGVNYCLEVINGIQQRYNHFEDHRYHMLVVKPNEKTKQHNGFRVI